uniref:Uncharacterized protein n=1 Tax=Arion vulgaris TaxID=1028688 RepID=A0A0B7BVB1_9EUPU
MERTWYLCHERRAGHEDVCGNERTDTLASISSIVGELMIDKESVLQSIDVRLLNEDIKIDVGSIQ